MTTREHINKEINKIMLSTVAWSAVITLGVAIAVLILAEILHYEISTSPLIVTLLVIGALMAFIGNNFVAHATTRWGATTSILWIWGNRVQSVGFIIVLVAAFL